MRFLYIAFVAVLMVGFAGVAFAADPYVGSYSCSDASASGCEKCDEIEVGGPSQMIVKSNGDGYIFCDQDGDCENANIQGGVASWDQTDSGDGLTVHSRAMATFSGNTLTLVDDATVSGLCNCEFHVKSICTK